MTQADGNPSYRALSNELRRLGYVERQNLIVERYSGEGHQERYAELAREVVRTKPHLIFAARAVPRSSTMATASSPARTASRSTAGRAAGRGPPNGATILSKRFIGIHQRCSP